MNLSVKNDRDAGRLSVWIAEEDVGNADFLRQVFGRTKIAEVHHFSDGNSLMRALIHPAGQRSDEKPMRCPDALLLDIHLPGLSGYEVLRRLPPLRRLKVFLITGALREFDELRARGPDVHGLFAKPISLGHVAELLGHFPLAAGRHAAGEASPLSEEPFQASSPISHACLE